MLVLLLATMVISNCGWHAYSSGVVPHEMKTIIFESHDINNLLECAIRNQLYMNGIVVLEKGLLCNNFPSFRILSSNLNQDITFISQNGNLKEYKIVLSVNSMLSFPEKGCYPVNTKIHRYFFSNSQTLLVEEEEKQVLISEMYQKAAIEIVRKFLNIKFLKRDNGETFSISSANTPIIIGN